MSPTTRQCFGYRVEGSGDCSLGFMQRFGVWGAQFLYMPGKQFLARQRSL